MQTNRQSDILKIVFIYTILGSLWIFCSDSISNWFVHDPDLLARVAVAKGIIFIIITSILLYFLINRLYTKVQKSTNALQESEAKLKTALASMTDAVFISDAAGNLVEMNHAWAAFSRLRNKEECLKTITDYPDLFEVSQGNGTTLPIEQWALPRALRGETVSNAEYTIRRKDTGEVWIGAYNFNPIRNNREEIIGAVMVARDITELKQKEQEQSQLKKQLQQAQKMEAIALCVNVSETPTP